MTIHLSGDREQFVRSLVQCGRYASEDEVIDEALRLLEQRDLKQSEDKKRVEALLIEGLDSGPSTPMTAEDWDAIEREGRRIIAAPPRPQGPMNDAIVLKAPQARIDLAVCYAWIGERNLDAARRFRQAAETTFEVLARSPGIGATYVVANPRLEGLRCARVRRFRNYLIFYRPIDGGIDVIRVLHAARNIAALLEEEDR